MATATQEPSRVCSSGCPQPVSVGASLALAHVAAPLGDPFGAEFLSREAECAVLMMHLSLTLCLLQAVK